MNMELNQKSSNITYFLLIYMLYAYVYLNVGGTLDTCWSSLPRDSSIERPDKTSPKSPRGSQELFFLLGILGGGHEIVNLVNLLSLRFLGYKHNIIYWVFMGFPSFLAICWSFELILLHY